MEGEGCPIAQAKPKHQIIRTPTGLAVVLASTGLEYSHCGDRGMLLSDDN